MTELKFFQVRDDRTHIPVLCVLLVAGDGVDSRELRRAGFGMGTPYYLLTNLLTNETQYDPYCWDDRRTVRNAHFHIEGHWPSLASGDVIDVEFLLGETTVKKEPEPR